jgi:transcriptional regulator with XRE-family HTH domain
MKKTLNIVGRQVGKYRNQRNWSQQDLAGRLQRTGWDISRSGVSKIEGGTVYVHDFQVTWLATVLGVPRDALYPQLDCGRPIRDAILRYIHNAKRGLVLPLASFSRLS